MYWRMEQREGGWCCEAQVQGLTVDKAVKLQQFILELAGSPMSMKTSGPSDDTVAERPSAKKREKTEAEKLSYAISMAPPDLPDGVVPLRGTKPLMHVLGTDLADTELCVRLAKIVKPRDALYVLFSAGINKPIDFIDTIERIKDRVPVLAEMGEKHGPKLRDHLARLVEYTFPHLGTR